MNWRDLVMAAASDPGLSKDKAEVEVLRVALGFAAEGLASLGEVAAVLDSHSKVKTASPEDSTGLAALVQVLNEKPAAAKKRPAAKKKPARARR